MKKGKSVDKNRIDEILYRSNYKVNESPRYKPITEKEDNYDRLPVEIYNTTDGMPVPQTPTFTNEADIEDAPPIGQKKPVDTDTSTDQPILQNPKEANPTDASQEPPKPPIDMNAPPTDQPMPPEHGLDPNPALAPEVPVDNIQNDIIKHNIEAMKAIHDQLEGLNDVVNGLNDKLKLLHADVEEVREPTNVEKLMNKTQVSYPYYFNLNDVWKGNFFDQNRESEDSKGMRKLPDGTYVADFDDLPQHSKIDVEKSFNEIV
jgi:hypothetical protein